VSLVTKTLQYYLKLAMLPTSTITEALGIVERHFLLRLRDNGFTLNQAYKLADLLDIPKEEFFDVFYPLKRLKHGVYTLDEAFVLLELIKVPAMLKLSREDLDDYELVKKTLRKSQLTAEKAFMLASVLNIPKEDFYDIFKPE
jgi:DNA-binding transcriptional MerR regulator